MDSVFTNLMLGFSVAMQPSVLAYAFAGCVIGTLVAYNHPISFAATKFGPVLGAGCSILIKAATQAPLSVCVSAWRVKEAHEPSPRSRK